MRREVTRNHSIRKYNSPYIIYVIYNDIEYQCIILASFKQLIGTQSKIFSIN